MFEFSKKVNGGKMKVKTSCQAHERRLHQLAPVRPPAPPNFQTTGCHSRPGSDPDQTRTAPVTRRGRPAATGRPLRRNASALGLAAHQLSATNY